MRLRSRQVDHRSLSKADLGPRTSGVSLLIEGTRSTQVHHAREIERSRTGCRTWHDIGLWDDTILFVAAGAFFYF